MHVSYDFGIWCVDVSDAKNIHMSGFRTLALTVTINTEKKKISVEFFTSRPPVWRGFRQCARQLCNDMAAI